VELYGHVSRVGWEIRIGREDREIKPVGYRAYEKVDSASGHATRPASVEKTRGLLVVRSENGNIIEVGQALPEALEVRLEADPRKDFLTDRTDETGPPVADEAPPLHNEPGLLRAQVLGAPS